MLDQEMKKKIESLRNILVGVVPNPLTQVEQITIGLIYKFMSDIDQKSENAGGKKEFFVGDYEKYDWKNLIDNKASGQDKFDLYIDAIDSFYSNIKFPDVFREIFKNANLPYKNIEVLRLFIQEINNFEYNDSEKLGDAFEYLLSFMGSQGDAGQFRTPRHIIDFIVDVVDPSVDDKILDPASGTSGFLISAFKHIVAKNSDKSQGDKLTITQRKNLFNNFYGYDISPEMIKIGNANMFLHGFENPNLEEYDTLTSEKHWKEHFNVILANPPFMTPKGGIKPHSKFSLKAKKSELLFLDYILSHLLPGGKGAVVVPDGILANNTPSSYISIRENLLENYCYAAVSLPQGVFKPYSEVKTTILFLDKDIASKTNEILFCIVENDGFDLGSRRKKLKTSDLPLITSAIKNFQKQLKLTEINKSNNIFLTDKNKILHTDNKNLSGKRYKIENFVSSHQNKIKLGELIVEKTTKVSEKEIENFAVSNKTGFTNPLDIFGKEVASENKSKYKIVEPFEFAYNPARINVGSIALNDTGKTICVSPMYVVFKIEDHQTLDPHFLLSLIKSSNGKKQIYKYSDGSVRQILNFEGLSLFDIPLPKRVEQENIFNYFKKIEKLNSDIADVENSIFKSLNRFWD